MRSRLLACGILAAVLSMSACNQRFKPTYPVRGEVLYEGKPAAGASIFLKPLDDPKDQLARPRGTVDEKGQFTLSTYKPNDGAPAGTYTVTLHWIPNGYQGPIEKVNKLPERYRNPETSSLTLKVEAKENTPEAFQLTK
jgi:hypothetical protein